MKKEFRAVLLFFVSMLLLILVLTLYQPILTGNASLNVRQVQGNLQGNLYVSPAEIGGVIPLDSEVLFEYNGLTSNIKLSDLLPDEVLALSQEEVDFAPLIRLDYDVVRRNSGGVRSRVMSATTTATSTSSGGGTVGGGSEGGEDGQDDGSDGTGSVISEIQEETVIYFKKDASANLVISTSDDLIVESVTINGKEISRSNIDIVTSKSGTQQKITLSTNYVEKVDGFVSETGQINIPLNSFFSSLPVAGGQASFKANLIYNGEKLVSISKNVFLSQAAAFSALGPVVQATPEPSSSGGLGNLPGFPLGVTVTNIVTSALAVGPEIGESSYTVVTPREFCRLINDCSYTNLDGVVSQEYSYTKKEMCYYGDSIYMKETKCFLPEEPDSSFNSYSLDNKVFVEKKNINDQIIFTVIKDKDLETIDILFNN